MKYGIQFKNDKGVKYVSSTRRSSGSFTTDITDIALFVQEKSAVDAVKELRRAGAEGDGNLEVVEINFTITRITHVPRPKTEEGFALVYDGRAKDRMFFCGTKTPKNRDGEWGDTNQFANKERSTVFATEAQAVARRDALERTAESYRAYNEQKGPSYWHRGPDEAEANFKVDMRRYAAEVKAMKNLKIVPHTK